MATAATMYYQGDAVAYLYPRPVDLASGVENLRLELDGLGFSPKVEALAVPSTGQTAYFNVRFTNDAGEILLPGKAFLYRQGAFIGATTIETVAPNAEAEIAFGAIDGLRLKRDMPLRSRRCVLRLDDDAAQRRWYEAD